MSLAEGDPLIARAATSPEGLEERGLSGRPAKSDGGRSAGKDLAEQFRAMGLCPLGGDFYDRPFVREERPSLPERVVLEYGSRTDPSRVALGRPSTVGKKDRQGVNVMACLEGRDPDLRGEFVVVGARMEQVVTMLSLGALGHIPERGIDIGSTAEEGEVAWDRLDFDRMEPVSNLVAGIVRRLADRPSRIGVADPRASRVTYLGIQYEETPGGYSSPEWGREHPPPERTCVWGIGW
jgi:hypothetical protein